MLLDKNNPEVFTKAKINNFTHRDYHAIAKVTYELYLKSERFNSSIDIDYWKKLLTRVNSYAVKMQNKIDNGETF